MATPNPKQLGILAAPLQKIEAASGMQTAELNALNAITLDLRSASEQTSRDVSQSYECLINMKDYAQEYGKEMLDSSKEGLGVLGGIKDILRNLEIQIPSMFEALNGTAEKLLLLFGDIAEAMQNQFQMLGAGMTATVDVFAKSLQEQNSHLKDIKGLLREGNSQKGGKGEKGGGMFQMPNLKGTAQFALGIVLIAGALVIAAGILTFTAVPSLAQIGTALAIAAVFLLIAPAFVKIVEVLDKVKDKSLMGSLKGMSPGGNFGQVLQTMAGPMLAMISMALGITVSSWILMGVAPFSGTQFLSALMVSVIMIPLGYAAVGFMTALKKGGIDLSMKGLKRLAMVPLAMAAVAMGMVASAYIFQLMPSDFASLPSVGWILLASLALLTFSYSMSLLLPALKGASLRDIFFATFAIPIVALGIVGAAWIMQLLPETFVSPPAMWSLKVGLALLVFATPFALVAVMVKKFGLGLKELGMGLLAVVAISIGILGVAWIFSVLPETWISPPIDWSFNAMLSITMFAVPVALLGLLATSGVGAVGILLGAVAVILIAGVVWAVAWIFSKLPTVDVGAIDAMSRGLMSPLHAMIDVLKRFKEEIGIDQMAALAGGIVLIAGAWLTLVAAIAGQAVGGVLSSIGNAVSGIIDGIGSLFGAKKTPTPIEILDSILNRGNKIKNIAEPLEMVGAAFMKITGSSGKLVTSMNAIKPLTSSSTAFTLAQSAEAWTKIARSSKKFAEGMNMLDIKKVRASTGMFRSLARLAEADGEDAMSKMADALFRAVKELSQAVNELEGVMGAMPEQQGGIISGAFSKLKDAVTGTTEEVKKIQPPPGGAEVNLTPVVNAIRALQERLDSPLQVKEADKGWW